MIRLCPAKLTWLADERSTGDHLSARLWTRTRITKPIGVKHLDSRDVLRERTATRWVPHAATRLWRSKKDHGSVVRADPICGKRANRRIRRGVKGQRILAPDENRRSWYRHAHRGRREKQSDRHRVVRSQSWARQFMLRKLACTPQFPVTALYRCTWCERKRICARLFTWPCLPGAAAHRVAEAEFRG